MYRLRKDRWGVLRQSTLYDILKESSLALLILGELTSCDWPRAAVKTSLKTIGGSSTVSC
jgi:hypothetical protein